MALRWPSKDPNDADTFHIVWCSPDATNDGSSLDIGLLQGDTIASVVWTVPTGITKVSDNTASVTIRGVTYPINTVTNIVLSGGTAGTYYTLLCRITLSSAEATRNGTTRDVTCVLKVEEH